MFGENVQQTTYRQQYGVVFTCKNIPDVLLQGPWLKYKGHLTNISENLCTFELPTVGMIIADSMYILVITVCDVTNICKPGSDIFQAVNDEGGDINKAFDHNQNISGTIPDIAKRFKARRQPWALIVDENYGEGSAREHAALQPRFYGSWRSLEQKSSVLTSPIGCAMIIARSFARIHETNLKVCYPSQ